MALHHLVYDCVTKTEKQVALTEEEVIEHDSELHHANPKRSQKQDVAIALSVARKSGAKIPKKGKSK